MAVWWPISAARVSGLELQRRLQTAGSPFPLIFVTGHGDIRLAVEAMKAGAVDFLQKPFRDQPFLDAIERAVELSRAHHAASQRSREARAILTRLSPRKPRWRAGWRWAEPTRPLPGNWPSAGTPYMCTASTSWIKPMPAIQPIWPADPARRPDRAG
ncbi:MAG: response regulator [Rivihabitans pingtungensis]